MLREIPETIRRRLHTIHEIVTRPTSGENEIYIALGLEYDILQEYGITVEEALAVSDNDLIEEDFRVPGRLRRTEWICDLIRHIQDFTDTRTAYRTNPIIYTFYGFRPDVQRAIYHAETLFEAVEHYALYKAPRGVTSILDYKEGLVAGIEDTMRRLNPFMGALRAPAYSTVAELTERLGQEHTQIISVKYETIRPFYDSRTGNGGYGYSPERFTVSRVDYEIGFKDGQTIDVGKGVGRKWRL